jgi:hypothetical protein
MERMKYAPMTELIAPPSYFPTIPSASSNNHTSSEEARSHPVLHGIVPKLKRLGQMPVSVSHREPIGKNRPTNAPQTIRVKTRPHIPSLQIGAHQATRIPSPKMTTSQLEARIPLALKQCRTKRTRKPAHREIHHPSVLLSSRQWVYPRNRGNGVMARLGLWLERGHGVQNQTHKQKRGPAQREIHDQLRYAARPWMWLEHGHVK